MFAALISCCGEDSSRRQSIVEKPNIIYHDQPGRVPPPSAEPIWADDRSRPRSRRINQDRNRSSSRGSFSGRMRWLSSSSRRPQISAPSNFRHVYSESFQFPESQLNLRPGSFHPLELSLPPGQQDLASAILPMFGPAQETQQPVTPPRPAHTQGGNTWDGNSTTLTHERSFSSMSFHLPRRPVRSFSSGPADPFTASSSPRVNDDGWSAVGSSQSSNGNSPPRIPLRSHARARAYTSPMEDIRERSVFLEDIVERIASAMIEKKLLQDELDSVIERQSLYINSRPSSPWGDHDLEPMPSIPALPAAAPSFAERLSIEGQARPRTAPAQAPGTFEGSATPAPTPAPLRTPMRGDSGFGVSPSLPMNSPTAYSRVRTNSPGEFRDSSFDRPLAPPLPLVLRPPLRKKKSFSTRARVSSWLFLGGGEASQPIQQRGEHQREISLDTVTNQPRPVTDREGFYQTVMPPEYNDSSTQSAGGRRDSFGSLTSGSSYETGDVYEDFEDEDEDEERQTVPTEPASSPAMKHETPLRSPVTSLGRRPLFATSAQAFAGIVGTGSATGVAAPEPVAQSEASEVPLPSGVVSGSESSSSSTATLTAPRTEGPRPQSVGVAF